MKSIYEQELILLSNSYIAPKLDSNESSLERFFERRMALSEARNTSDDVACCGKEEGKLILLPMSNSILTGRGREGDDDRKALLPIEGFSEIETSRLSSFNGKEDKFKESFGFLKF